MSCQCSHNDGSDDNIVWSVHECSGPGSVTALICFHWHRTELHSLDCSLVTYRSQNAAHIHLPYIMLHGSYTNVYTPCKVNSVDRSNRYHTLYMKQKCFTWSDSGTKNVPRPDRSDVVPARNSTSIYSGGITISVCRKERRWFAVSSQLGLHDDYTADLELVERRHPSDFLLLRRCHHRYYNESERCDSIMDVHLYPHVLQVLLHHHQFINSFQQFIYLFLQRA